MPTENKINKKTRTNLCLRLLNCSLLNLILCNVGYETKYLVVGIQFIASNLGLFPIKRPSWLQNMCLRNFT